MLLFHFTQVLSFVNICSKFWAKRKRYRALHFLPVYAFLVIGKLNLHVLPSVLQCLDQLFALFDVLTATDQHVQGCASKGVALGTVPFLPGRGRGRCVFLGSPYKKRLTPPPPPLCWCKRKWPLPCLMKLDTWLPSFYLVFFPAPSPLEPDLY